MILSDLDKQAIFEGLRGEGLGFCVGPFFIRLNSKIQYVADMMSRLYADYPIVPQDEFFDFQIAVNPPRNLRRLLGRQVQFYFDGEAPFKPLPFNQAFPFFEWGLNWCVAQHAHQYLLIHAAVVEKDGIAAIFPGSPGAGKSTFSASLVARGWRLLSDEMALIPEGGNQIVPIPRPIALKNDSIELMKEFAPDETFGNSFHDTAKGTVAHMRPPKESVVRAGEPARPALVVFPKFEAGSSAGFEPVSQASAFLQMVEYAFNYDFLGIEGFRRMQRLIESSICYSFTYPSLEAALQGFERIWNKRLEEM